MKNISGEFHPTIQGKEEQENEDKEKEEEEKARCEWDFKLSSIVSSNVIGAATDTLGIIEFDPSDQFLATGGIARKIRFYTLNSLIQHENATTTLLDHASAIDYYICTPAKLSSLRWRPDSGGRIVGSGDYDGVVTEYDLERRTSVFERDEHGGRRVWSMDYSRLAAPLGASGSDDGTAQLWDPRSGGSTCVGIARPGLGPAPDRSPICCVEFDPLNGSLLAMGSADKRAYTFDIRKMSVPVSVFSGHRKTVTYVRFLGENLMVSAGTDGCLKLWDMQAGRTIRTYKGHVNSRSFVGLSVWRNGGLFGCGSESNEVFVYDKRWGEPIWLSGFESLGRAGSDHGFVSSVCWRQTEEEKCTLVAGGSNGVLQFFVGKRKSSSFDEFSHLSTI
ncbi:WD repeat-containing protein RUP2-like [Tasmannia lanceolata]|uniref:WD repeat-containing protein RUP2-like n=1 Tax=Tasmannia lanceolata TaxID=3420 RepID=UPI0040648E9E